MEEQNDNEDIDGLGLGDVNVLNAQIEDQDGKSLKLLFAVKCCIIYSL